MKNIDKRTVKQKFIELTPDGKQEIVEGSESLKKDPRSLKQRWKKLKKGLNNLKSILDLQEESQPESQPEPTQAQSQKTLEQDGRSESEQTPTQDVVTQGAQQEQEQEQEQAQPQEFNVDSHEQEIIDALKQEGYSDSEIAYIVHGHHSAPIDENTMAQAEATRLQSDMAAQHVQDIHDTENNFKRQSSDLDLHHAKRMKDIEYHNALMQTPDPEITKQIAQIDLKERELELESRRKQIELELEFKRKELELKIKQAEALGLQRLKDKTVDKNSKSEGQDVKN